MSAEDLQNRLQEAVKRSVDKLDKEVLRRMECCSDDAKLQALRKKISMYECCIGCAKDQNSSIDQKEQCVKTCQQPLQQAQEILSNELQGWQNRVQRSVQECQDQIQDQYKSQASAGNVDQGAAQRDFEKCVGPVLEDKLKQFDQTIAPNIQKQIEKVAQNNQR